MKYRSPAVCVFTILTLYGCAKPSTDQDRSAAQSVATLQEIGIQTPDLQEMLDAMVPDGDKANSNKVFAVAGSMPNQALTDKVLGENADGSDILALDGGVGVSFCSTTAGKPQIVGLQIDHTKTDDQLLKQLATIKPLRSLKIENSVVTTEGLQLLKTLPHLKQLCIAKNNPKVSDSDLESLRKELQNCRVFRDITLYNPHE